MHKFRVLLEIFSGDMSEDAEITKRRIAWWRNLLKLEGYRFTELRRMSMITRKQLAGGSH